MVLYCCRVEDNVRRWNIRIKRCPNWPNDELSVNCSLFFTVVWQP